MIVIFIQLKGYQFFCSRDFLLPVVVNGHGSTVQVVENHDCFLFVNRFGVAENLDFHNKTFTQLTLTIYLKGMFNMDTIMSIRMEEGTQNVPEIYKWVPFQFLTEYDVEMYLYHILSERSILSSQTALKQMGTGVYSIKKKLKAKLCRF